MVAPLRDEDRPRPRGPEAGSEISMSDTSKCHRVAEDQFALSDPVEEVLDNSLSLVQPCGPGQAGRAYAKHKFRGTSSLEGFKST